MKDSLIFESFTNIFLLSSMEIKESEKKKASLNKLSHVYLTLYTLAKNIYAYIFPQGHRIPLFASLYGFNRETRIEIYFRKFSSNCGKCGSGE